MLDGFLILKWLSRLFIPYQENMLLAQISRQIHKRTINTLTHTLIIHAICNIDMEINLFFLLSLVKSWHTMTGSSNCICTANEANVNSV